jgi:hypothetical protein
MGVNRQPKVDYYDIQSRDTFDMEKTREIEQYLSFSNFNSAHF